MRIKVKQIKEAIDTSSTSSPQDKNAQTQSTSPEEIKKVTDAVKELDKEMEESPLMAFMKMTENTPGDTDDFTSDAIDAMADREEKNRQDYNEWLQSPEGQEYIKSFDLLNESISGRKIIKTIKVKDLK